MKTVSFRIRRQKFWNGCQARVVQAIEVGARFIPEGKEAEVSRLFASYGLAIAGLHMGAPVYSDSCEEKLTGIFAEINRLQSVKPERIVLSGGGGKGALTNEGTARAAGFLNRIGGACNKVGVNYAALIQSAKQLGYSGWYLVEMELGAHCSGNAATPEQSVEISLQNLKKLA